MSLVFYEYIENFIDSLYNNTMKFFIKKKSILKTILVSDCIVPNISGRKYLEILLKEELLNQKDVDLLDIEINYTITDDIIELEGEFYGSDGVIFCEFKYKNKIIDRSEIEYVLTSFMSTIKCKYDTVVKNYIYSEENKYS